MKAVASRHMVVGDREYEFPYSKGLMASAIMATGLAPGRAFHVAEVIEERLDEPGRGHHLPASSSTSWPSTCCAPRWATATRSRSPSGRWCSASTCPLVILLGGATGVGKSTIATMLASRLGITRVIPTDAVREVMRSMFTADLFPSLHTSSFDAARLVKHPLPRSADPVIIGFREQVSAVAVGIEALVSRAVSEGTDLIIEGAHVVPGFFDLDRFEGKAVVVPHGGDRRRGRTAPQPLPPALPRLPQPARRALPRLLPEHPQDAPLRTVVGAPAQRGRSSRPTTSTPPSPRSSTWWWARRSRRSPNRRRGACAPGRRPTQSFQPDEHARCLMAPSGEAP